MWQGTEDGLWMTASQETDLSLSMQGTKPQVPDENAVCADP